jgi:hypothetical protein
MNLELATQKVKLNYGDTTSTNKNSSSIIPVDRIR